MVFLSHGKVNSKSITSLCTPDKMFASATGLMDKDDIIASHYDW